MTAFPIVSGIARDVEWSCKPRFCAAWVLGGGAFVVGLCSARQQGRGRQSGMGGFGVASDGTLPSSGWP